MSSSAQQGRGWGWPFVRRAAAAARDLRAGGLLVFIPFAIFCFVYPFAILLLSFDWMPFGMEWMSSLLLLMLGLSCLGWLWAGLGRRGLLTGLAIFVGGVGVEYLGVATGFPFGPYIYTGVLVPGLPGGVPLAIGFAWVLVIVGGYGLSRLLSAGLVPVALLGAAFAVGLDLLLEPVAYHVKSYWRWLTPQGEGYYGIPWSNFGAWLAIAALLGLLLGLVAGSRGNTWRWPWPWLPPLLYSMNLLMFGIVNLAHGFWWAGAIMLLISPLLALSMRRALSAPTPSN